MPQGFQLSQALNITEDHNPREQIGYSEPEIEEIKDPAAASDYYEITSVPSPYARWHLFDQAFQWVTDQALKSNGEALEGGTIYHKLVAEALDIGEIFFSREAINAKGDRKVTVKSFPFQREVEQLSKSANAEQQNLGETYDLFGKLKQEDGSTVSLYDAEEIHMLYIDGIAVGGTSPISMYFTGVDTSEDSSFNLGANAMFKAPHESLLKRGQAFIIAQIAMVNDFSAALSRHMPGFCNYINYIKGRMSQSRDLVSFDKALVRKYVDRDFLSGSLSVLRTPSAQVHLYTPKAAGVDSSDLVLGMLDGSPVSTADRRPLVLLPNHRRESLYYNEVRWDPAKMEGFAGDNPDINQRILPGQHVQYPWVTVSDFLEPTIVRLPGPLDTERFKANPGHTHGRNLQSETGDYLLPIKPLFFQYFTWADLFSTVQGKPMLEMQRSPDDRDVEVTLRLPIGNRKEILEMRRTYKKGSIPNEMENKGAAKELLFNLALIPDLSVAKYRAGMVLVQEQRDPEYPVSMGLYASWENDPGHPLEPVKTGPYDPILRVDPAKYAGQGTIAYHPESRFDMIHVNIGQGRGGWLFLDNVPQTDSGASKQFDIAVDFGTTNTHVEIRDRSGGDYRGLSLEHPAACLRTLFPYAVLSTLPELRTNLLMRSFYQEIGEDKQYSFPIRTAIAESESSKEPEVLPIARKNIPFYYLHESSPAPDQIFTNLKWSDLRKVEDKSRLRHFISSLLQIAAGEIVARGGDLNAVRLVYFFPSSMEMGRQAELTSAWKNAYKTYFGNAQNYLQSLSESVAPYQYFAHAERHVWRGERTINCDIGGGTCDAYIHYAGAANTPKIASFRFGGNAVFGDGYDTNKGKNNGFIAAAMDAVKTVLNTGDSPDHSSTRDTYQQLMNRAISSEEVISFYLSLSNRDLHKEVHFDFNEYINLHKPQLKLVYLIYYGGIIYHLLQVTKSMGLERPSDITFTGNGSKILQALAPDKVLSIIGNYLADGVYAQGDSSSGHPLRVVTFEKPKDYTCKGGLAMIAESTNLNTDYSPPQNVVVLGTDTTLTGKDMHFVEEGGRIQGEAPTYGELQSDQQYKADTVASVETFLDLLFDINRKFSFKSNLNLNIGDWDAAKAEIKRDLPKGYTSGLQEREKESHAGDAAKETLFFHPLRNAIYNLSRTLATREI